MDQLVNISKIPEARDVVVDRTIGVRKRDAIQLARQVHAWCPVEVQS